MTGLQQNNITTCNNAPLQEQIGLSTVDGKHIFDLNLLPLREFETPGETEILKSQRIFKKFLDKLDDDCSFSRSFFNALIMIKHCDKSLEDNKCSKQAKEIYKILLDWCKDKGDDQIETLRRAVKYGLFTKKEITCICSGSFTYWYAYLQILKTPKFWGFCFFYKSSFLIKAIAIFISKYVISWGNKFFIGWIFVKSSSLSFITCFICFKVWKLENFKISFSDNFQNS